MVFRFLIPALFMSFGTLFMASTVHAQTCDELKLACDNKDALGERGLGNCRKYREACEQHRRGDPYCSDLRSACLHKHELGEAGQGNCRKYREECH